MLHQPILQQNDMATLLTAVASASSRPRYAFMLLSLIARQARTDGSAGPFVLAEDQQILIRDWLSSALGPIAARDPRRRALYHKGKEELRAAGSLPDDPARQELAILDRVREQVRIVGKCNLSRVVSELVRAGLLRRHYEGYRVDHHNRGAQRHAVYTLTGPALILMREVDRGRLKEPIQASLPLF